MTETGTATLASPLTLPGGHVLPNRVVKAAMSEQLATVDHAPTPELERLYERWARGGAGLVITGNVMTDRRSIGEPRNVVVEDDRDLAALRRWATAARSGGTTAIVQVNHPGRQILTGTSERVVGPSDRRVEMGPAFAKPRALRSEEVPELVDRFAETSRLVVGAGFDGVQLHAAHGYLVNQFLSPRVNTRDDEWGGDPERVGASCSSRCAPYGPRSGPRGSCRSSSTPPTSSAGGSARTSPSRSWPCWARSPSTWSRSPAGPTSRRR